MPNDQDTWRYRQWVEEIDEADESILSEWERDDFLPSIRDRVMGFETLTDRQIEILERIYVKTGMKDIMDTHAKQISDCMEVMEEFCSTWEINFLESVHAQLVDRKKPLTAPQGETLHKIYQKVCEAEEKELRGGD